MILRASCGLALVVLMGCGELQPVSLGVHARAGSGGVAGAAGDGAPDAQMPDADAHEDDPEDEMDEPPEAEHDEEHEDDSSP